MLVYHKMRVYDYFSISAMTYFNCKNKFQGIVVVDFIFGHFMHSHSNLRLFIGF